ncbi:1-acyl-sn-glycerol-3-phosphate acyltransferase [uncultured Hydrogenophaga sp.]|uniref:lysophospholipid acyltransferase family protein n=1 Tax=uncultured Hydrogenophaga sp. TaxID=199683 RepID=UPI0026603CB4|nr:lysophospholipid acyltransferase family protein [uncultured Hydrogenophaga sp.]
MKPLRALVRAARAVGHVVRGLWIIRTEFGRITPAQADLRVREWSRGLLRILGVELSVRGELPSGGPMLQVANHTSWLDIIVMNAARPSRFVSKADARHWPLLGSLITGAGTLYIEREKRRDAMRVVHHVAERLQAGDVISVFPEGTTSDGTELLSFHANLFQAAISAPAPVLPVGLAFIDADTGRPHPAPVFVGDTTLVASIWNVLSADRLLAVVHYGLPEECLGRDRRTWAQQVRDEVDRLRRTDPA